MAENHRATTAVALLLTSLLAAAGVLLAAGCARTPAPTPPAAPALVATSAAPTGDTGGYVGDAACAECHGPIAEQHRRTAHATTLTLVTAQQYGPTFRLPARLDDPSSRTTYRVAVQDNRCVLITDGPDGVVTTPAELAVGSGRNGVTFLGHVDPVTWATLRLSYYASIHRWLFSPGQGPGHGVLGAPAGTELAGEEAATCLRCHVTDLRRGPEDLDIAHSRLAIGCEACHGPGRAHAESAREMAAGKAARIAPLAHLAADDPASVEAVCGRCHAAAVNAMGADQDSRTKIVRFQTTALEASRCFREGRALSCVTCHGPHDDAAHGPRATAAYEAACLRCHGGGAGQAAPAGPTASGSAVRAVHGRICPVNPRSGCIGCHMPATRLPDVPSNPFHNHWIKVWKGR